MLVAMLAVSLPAPARARAAGSSAADDIRAAVAQALRDKDAPLDFMASDIATRHGRDAVPHLVDALLQFDTPPKTPHQNESAALLMIDRSLMLALDPRDEDHLRSSECWSNWAHATRLAVATLARRGGDDRRELLIRLATGRYAYGDYFAGEASSVACGLLRADADPDALLKQVESAQAGAGRHQQANLRALQSSLKYTLAIDDPRRREAYAAFETKLWRTWAMTPPNQSRIGGLEPRDAARDLRPQLADGDREFVLRIFQEHTTTREETRIAQELAILLRDEQLAAGLQAVAATDSPKAAAARATLERLHRTKPLAGSRPPGSGPNAK
jgi:hypothetical protein